jgi:hypothetical protein
LNSWMVVPIVSVHAMDRLITHKPSSIDNILLE